MFKQVVDAVRQLLLLLRDMEQKQTFLLVVGAGLHFISCTPTPATAAESGAVTSQASPSPALPAPGGVPQPGPTNDAPYVPQPILQGGVVIPLYPAGSPFLKRDRVREAEKYNMCKSVQGRINSIVNIHNPSVEMHRAEVGLTPALASSWPPGVDIAR